MAAETPSVGRIIHYRDNGYCLAGLVTGVRKVQKNGEDVQVFDARVFRNERTPGDEELWVADQPMKEGEPNRNGDWHWPERV